MLPCKLAAGFLCSVALFGCADYGPNQVAKPTDITIEQAMVQVVDGIAAAKKEAMAKKVVLGIATCSVVSTFNVTAQANNGGKLVLDATIKAPAPVNAGFGATGEQNSSATSSRGNTVVITLTSESCLPAGVSGTVMAEGIYGAKPASNTKPGQQPVGQPPAPPTPPPAPVVNYPQPSLHDIFNDNGQVLFRNQ
jgi:hypothetical protein